MRKKVRISFNSPVVLGFVIICFAALLLGYITRGATTNLLFSVYPSSLLNPFTYLRLVCHVFGHANWEHFAGNIMIILIIGPLLEEKYGSLNMVLVILVTAVVTGVLNILLFPHTQLLGASGVVFALILLSSFTSIKEGTIPLTFILVAAVYIGEQIFSGIFVHDNVSNFTHIIGGIIGASMGYVMNRHKY